VVTRTLESAEAQGQNFAQNVLSNSTGNCSIQAVQYNYTRQVQCMRAASPSALFQGWLNGGGFQV
jgi:DUF971 family protein